MVFNLFSRQPQCLILAIEMQDARTASRIHGEAFARAWGDGEFESLISQQSVFGFLACPEGRARDAAAGFVLSREAAGEAEILSIGISPRQRRAGLGWRLMLSAMQEPGAAAPRRCFSRSTRPTPLRFPCTAGSTSSRLVNAAPIMHRRVRRARRRLSCAAIFASPQGIVG
jgi:ribosomal protein S18 acetylase RimI-like enzyme